jgi:hypothetical protein
LIKGFIALGWEGPVQGRKHSFMYNGPRKVRIPNEHGEDTSRGLLAEILRQADIDADDWPS